MPTTELESTEEIAAAAIVEFANRWERLLGNMAKKAACQCSRLGSQAEEFDHRPSCPVAMFRQAARLMQAEAAEATERAQQS